MPPKAKESKPTAVDPDAAAAEQKALMESELVTALLRSRLGRYQAAGEKLAVENFVLSDELAKQKLTLQDINEFLTNELKARSLATAQLEERVGQLSTTLAEVQKESKVEIARVKAEAAAEVAAATARAAAAASTAALDAASEGNPADAAGQKAQLERTIAELTAALSARQKDFEARISDMERRQLQEKEKMRKEAAAKIRETKVAMAQLADQHLESSTKRTLVENETMVAELAYHTAQSHDLVAANSMLRNETAELRRQLAIANKTVQSTARKNLLLQQTIKSILTCLREEARTNAEATVAAHQQQHQPCVSHAACDSPTSGVQVHSPGAHAHPGEQQHWQHWQQQQQQQQDTGDADAVLQHLEARVGQLTDELLAAKQATAAALQGCLPAGTQAQCTLTAAAGAAAMACGRAQVSSRDNSPADRQQQQQRRGQRPHQHQQGGVDGGSSSTRCCHCGSGGQLGPVEAALEDGVAAFVLHCVQQLRRGGVSSTRSPSRSQTAGTAAARPDRGNSSSSSVKPGSRQSTGGRGGSRSSSPATGTRAAAAAAAAAGKGAAGTAVASRVGADSSSSQGPANTPAAAAAATAAAAGGSEGMREGGDSSREAAAAGAAEQLARLLLDQLRSYSRHNLVPFDGLVLDFGDSGQDHQQQQQQQGEEGEVGLDYGPAGQGVACSEIQWPAAPLQVLGPAAAAAAAAAGCLSPGAALQQAMGADGGAGCVGGEECSSSLQLPALPCLLNNMGRNSSKAQGQQQLSPGVSPAGARAGSPAAAAAVLAKGGRSKSPGRGDREGLFTAVLSELRPWGAGAGSAGALGSTTAAAAGALVSPNKLGPAGAAASGLFGRSKTPTSPAAAAITGMRGSPISSPSSKAAKPGGHHC